METSLRYSSDYKALKIHAKEKFPIDSKTHLQVHGELDTQIGASNFFSAMIRHSYPEFSASLGMGLLFDKHQKLRYNVRAKKAFLMTTNESLSFNIKGRCDVDQEFRQRKSNGAAELSWTILNVKADQDLRLKVGFDLIDKVPYCQIRENNWTFNADLKGRWNVRYDL